MERKTPLYETHLKYGAKMFDFGGFIMPVQYKAGIKAEHMAVRQACGLFDVSHYGEVIISGPKALEAINMLLTNDYTSLKVGSARYGMLCNDKGGIKDDMITFKKKKKKYMITVNSETQITDVEWMKSHSFGAEVTDISAEVGSVSLQGPLAEKVIGKVTDAEGIPAKYYTFKQNSDIKGIKCMISRTGYTGEKGFEIYTSADEIANLWEIIMEAGKEEGILPIGLGAKDTLRLEAGMPLYGNDLNEEINPLEADLGFAVKLNKPDFIGKKAMEEKGAPYKRVGFTVKGRGIVREDEDLYVGDGKVGFTTSGTYCAYLKQPLAMGYVRKEYTAPGTVLEADVRGRRVEIEVAQLPFYKRAD